jgi:hypothetical protein
MYILAQTRSHGNGGLALWHGKSAHDHRPAITASRKPLLRAGEIVFIALIWEQSIMRLIFMPLRKAHSLLNCLLIVLMTFLGPWCRAATLPPVPAGFILDDTNLLSAEQTAALEAALKKLSEHTGASVYVYATTFAEPDKARDNTAALAGEWLGDRPGLVISYRRTRKFQVTGTSPAFWRRYPASDAAALVASLLERLNDPKLSPDAKVVAATEEAVARITELEKMLPTGPRLITRTDALIATGFGVFILAGGIIAWLLLLWRSRIHARESVTIFFPEVRAATRLGAPFGGGTIAEVKLK